MEHDDNEWKDENHFRSHSYNILIAAFGGVTSMDSHSLSKAEGHFTGTAAHSTKHANNTAEANHNPILSQYGTVYTAVPVIHDRFDPTDDRGSMR